MARQQKETTQTITDLSALLPPGLFDNFFDEIKLPASRKPKSHFSPPPLPSPSAPTTPASSSYHSLPTNDSPAYLKVKTKLEHLFLESILQESTAHPFAAISLSDIGRRASTNPKYIPFNEDYIPALLEKYVTDRLIQQEFVTLTSGRTQPIYALNALNKPTLEHLLSTTQDPFEIQKESLSPRKKNRTRRIRLTPEKKQDVATLCTLGLSANDIATEMNISTQIVYKIGRELNLSFKKHDAHSIGSIKQLLAEDNLIDIYRKFSFPSAIAFYDYCNRYNITIPQPLTPHRLDISIDTLIEQGKSLEEIGELNHKTREWARQYIVGSGWYGQWVQKRQEQTQEFQTKKEKATQAQLLSILSQRLVQHAATESWAMQKAVEYFVQLDKRYHEAKPFSTYVTLFQSYEQAQQQGEKVTLQELAERAGFAYASTVGRIFAAVNVEPMFGNKVRSQNSICRPKLKLEALARGAQIGLGVVDISYFVDIPYPTVYKYLSTHYGSVTPTTVIELEYKSTDRRKIEKTASYSLASQIYEAADEKFSLDEIRMLLPKPKGGRHDSHKIQEILTSRPHIEPLLITLLQKLYNKPELTKPYKISF
ncbi:MAG: hypothetical protein A3D39_00605 [Candidatus Buchananbacteria bacterium RIFCSPHIGHO2_02_FULL_39_17]|uniref:Uncharacterized protein n=1 Tax=Candidatus Buchananbacteria bacterium RIFCSPLOWO2_01_FULL_40_23b TaxID=1797544 RepID=A0A1G1YLD3_9BACT|nr:MAG: hypothetical protein A3D39_00605 [Candidatus Buchananbacteria bacterium RIFCSPHIGHO2_02_FULL_39_17]OGY53165.1 MAG: hypothetical protein A2912_04285 [Candidatus Buchananbacteria bacterium RIFCSPLOWO2_01_FULL_40_23b]